MTTFNILDYSPKDRVPSVTDDSPAFEAMLADSMQKALNDSPHWELPPSYYFCSRAVNLHQTGKLFGPGGNFLNRDTGAQILFGPNSISGVVVHERRTTDDGGGGPGVVGPGDAGGSILEGFTVFGPGMQAFSGPWRNPNAKNRNWHGIWVRAACAIKDITGAFSSGHGLCIKAYATATGPNFGQASFTSVEKFTGIYNALDPINVEGGDANVCSFRDISAISNGGGLTDNSFLGGNNWEGLIHTRDNCQYDPIGSGAINGSCLYQGVTYFLVAGADDAAQIELAKTVVPGTNENVWRRWDIANWLEMPVWTPGQTWRITAPFRNGVSVTQRSTCKGLYTELGQPQVQIKAGMMLIGGPIDVGVIGDGCYLMGATTGGAGLAAPGFTTFGNRNRQLWFGSDFANNVIAGQNDDASANFALKLDNDSLWMQHDNRATSLRWTLANHPVRPMATVADTLIISYGAEPKSGGLRIDYVDNPGAPFCNYYSNQNDLVGRVYGRGDIVHYIGAAYTGSAGKLGMGLRCSDVLPPASNPQGYSLTGIYGNTDSDLPTAVLVEFGEPIAPLRFQDLAYIFQPPRPGQPAMVSNCSHQNLGQPADGNGNFLVRVMWNKVAWTVIGA